MRRRWSGLPRSHSRSNLLKRNAQGIRRPRAFYAGKLTGVVMQCLACRADNKMLLMDVLRDDTVKVPVIEHQIYMCSACRHIARRLVFRRTQNPGERGREAAQQTDRTQRESSSSEDCWLDEGCRESPCQTGGSCGTSR